MVRVRLPTSIVKFDSKQVIHLNIFSRNLLEKAPRTSLERFLWSRTAKVCPKNNAHIVQLAISLSTPNPKPLYVGSKKCSKDKTWSRRSLLLERTGARVYQGFPWSDSCPTSWSELSPRMIRIWAQRRIFVVLNDVGVDSDATLMMKCTDK